MPVAAIGDHGIGNGGVRRTRYRWRFSERSGNVPVHAGKGAQNKNGWGHNESEYYTNRLQNARVEGGSLVIEARQESFGGKNYTSARLKTQGEFSQKYGKIEGRMKIPGTQGIWPAFWMLGDDIATVGWPGYPDGTTVFPQKMLVDNVRVYERAQ